MQTPLIPMAAGQSTAIFPVTGWMPLPEVKKVQVHSSYVTEVDATAAKLQALLQFSDDGWEPKGGAPEPTLGALTTQTPDTWMDIGDTEDLTDLASTYSGLRYVRLAVKTQSALSGTGDDTRVVPFRASLRYSVETRQVRRVPIEQRLVGNDNSNSPSATWRLTSPIPLGLGGDSLKVRAVYRPTVMACKAGTPIYKAQPMHFRSKDAINPNNFGSGDVIDTNTISMGTMEVSDEASIATSGQEFGFLCFGFGVYDANTPDPIIPVPWDVYMAFDGFFEVYEA